MSSVDVFGMAVRNLFKRKLRTFLTVLGVIIGTAAIVVMMSLGIGMNNTFMESLQRQGDLMTVNVYMPYNYSSYGGGVMVMDSRGGSGASRDDELRLDDNAIERFKHLPGAVTATPFVDIGLKAVSGRYQTYFSIRGMDPDAMNLLGYTVSEGRLLTGEERYEVVFGYNVPFDFYNPSDRNRTYEWWWWGSGEPDTRVAKVNVMEDKIQMSYDWQFGERNPSYTANTTRPKPYTVNVVGKMPPNGNNDYYVYMAIDEVLRIQEAQEKFQNSGSGTGGSGSGSGNRRNQGPQYSNAVVKFADIRSVEQGIEDIRSLGYNAYGLAESLREMQNMTDSLQLLLGAIGAVSLFVAAIGISNTMVMSIYERTREIGIMKVIGASIKDIKRLFLLEAALIGIFGGFFGAGLSLAVSKVINTVGIPFFDRMVYGANDSDISAIPAWLCLFALGFSAFIGLFSGYFPARRATKLSALTAIRTE